MPIQRRQAGLFSVDTDVDLLDVDDRKTDELIIGFVGPIGSGISYCANIFSEKLRSQFGYDGKTLKVSTIINQSAKVLQEEAVEAATKLGNVVISHTNDVAVAIGDNGSNLARKARRATIKIYLCNDLFDEVGISKCLSQLRTKMLQLFGSTIMVGASPLHGHRAGDMQPRPRRLRNP
ncbi:hypothetical protein ACQPTN_27230 [Bradyrhizobium sp. 13971]